MDADFWLQKWDRNDIAFHESEANPALVKHSRELGLAQGSRVFVPLCGKTLDIGWLLSQGYRVVGAELSQKAIEQLFEGLEVQPAIIKAGDFICYSAHNIDIFVGDIFKMTKEMLGRVEAVYDRAALVALPPDVRQRYTAHLMDITGRAPQLLVSFEYDQSLMEGPPFSVGNQEVKAHYQSAYKMTLLDSADIPGGLKGKFPAKENVWLLIN
jgi:thiopurine S-methyltransferase